MIIIIIAAAVFCFFLYLKAVSKKKQPVKTQEVVSTAKPEEIEKITNLIKEKTEKKQYAIEIEENKVPSIFDSKFGGYPYWDFAKEYPVNESGEKMQLLAQINFSKEALNDELLPQKGMLQFFIAANSDYMGMDFDDETNQKDFRIVFHEDINDSVSVEKVKELGMIPGFDNDSTPVLKECAFKLKKEQAFIDPSDYDYSSILEKTIADAGLDKNLCDDDSLKEKLHESLCKETSSVLGYPSFTQSDPRENLSEDDAKYFDTVLLKMNSFANSNYIMWGDMGIGNFLINSQALKTCDFSKVLFNWDCY